MSSSVETPSAMVIDSTYAARPVARPKRRRWLLIAIPILVVGILVLSLLRPAAALRSLFGAAASDEAFYVVEPLTLNVTLKEDGELKPVNSVDIKCEVQSQRFQGITIRWIVDESTRVKKGDLLVELGSDDMKDRVETEQLELDKLAGGLENARQALTITQSENESAIKKAEIDLDVARLELQRYLEGDYKKFKKQIEIDFKQTDMDIDQLEDELAKSENLLKKDFVTQQKVKELEDALEKAQLMLEKHELEMMILDEYELPKNKKQKTSAAERAKEELKREKERAASRLKQAEIRVQDQSRALVIRQNRFERLREQLENCKIHSPVDGVVQYGGGGRHRWGGGNRIAAGEQVQQGQTLITIPDTSRMMVATRIHEADRHKVREGLTCLVKVPAVPGETFVGKLTKIDRFADSERGWINPNLKEHAVEILLDDMDAPLAPGDTAHVEDQPPAGRATPADQLAPGDTAHVEILIEELPNVLAVPVQCVFSRGKRHFVFRRQGGSTEPVEVAMGRATTTMVEIAAGLSVGDKVVMAPDQRLLAMLPAPNTE